jgi:hypothetical protein
VEMERVSRQFDSKQLLYRVITTEPNCLRMQTGQLRNYQLFVMNPLKTLGSVIESCHTNYPNFLLLSLEDKVQYM